jgi:hypothetical protein
MAAVGVFNRARYIGLCAFVVLASFSIVAVAADIVRAITDPTLVGGSAVTGYSASPAPITDLQVSGTGNPTVPVKLLVTNGSLSMSTTTGLTFTGPSTGSTLQFSGTLANVNTALATLSYTRTGTGTDTLEASLVNAGEVFLPSSGHLYEYVSYTGTWGDAKTNAESRTKYSAVGYLTTITSQAENDFVSARLLNAGWMGASDSVSEGAWRWVTGPENGTQFWSGGIAGATTGGNYANWSTNEPNDSGANEDCAQFLTGGTGKWNDLPCTGTTLPGYVVEYGSDSSPIDIASKNVAITTLAANLYPNVPSSLGPTNYINASWHSSSAPTFSFSLSDPDVGNTVKYQLQVDDTMNFSSPVIDYTSALSAQGAKIFTVGQAAGSGSYAVGSSGQTLPDRQYYWRVKTIDNVAAASSYVAANSGNIAFRIDTGAPNTPPTPSTTALTSDTTPTWSWGAIDDQMSGFGTLQLEWSEDPTFATDVTTDQTDWPAFDSFTHTTLLSDGVWYFRTKATDAAGNVSGYSENGSVTIDTTDPVAPGTPITTSPSATNKPTWTWAASTDDGGGMSVTQPYTFDFTQNPSFTSYTSYNSLPTNSFTHTVALADGTWYARVIAFDKLSHSSVSQSLGSVVVDTTSPSTPQALTSGSPPASHTPTLSWAPSTDAGTGLANPAYTLEWSLSADFSSGVGSVTTNDTSLTLSPELGDGTWYFRVKATDISGNDTVFSTVFSKTILTPVLRSNIVRSVDMAQDTTAQQDDATADAAPADEGADIVLNEFASYADGNGKQLSLRVGQVIYFYMGEERHSITVKEIGSDYVIVTIASSPTDVRVALGRDTDQDVDKDGVDDMNIALASLDGQSAAMVFTQLFAKPAVATARMMPSQTDMFNWWVICGVAGGIVISILAVVARRHRNNQNK